MGYTCAKDKTHHHEKSTPIATLDTLAPRAWDNAATWTGLESGGALMLTLGEGHPA